jgi:hypothetical protein
MNILKNYLWLGAVLLSVACVLSSCKKSEEIGEEVFVSSDYIVVDANVNIGANSTIAVMEVRSNCDWFITVDGAWQGLQLSTLEGTNNENVNIETPRNLSQDERSAVLTFKNDDGTINRVVTVRQAAGDIEVELSVDPVNIEVIAQGEEKTAKVTCNTDWTVAVDADAPWCVSDKQKGVETEVIKFTIQANQTPEERRAKVVISSGNRTGNKKEQIITIIQNAAPKPSPIITSAVVNDANNKITVTASFQSLYDVTEYGYCYDTKPEPTTDMTVVGTNGGTNKDFTFTIDVEDGRTYFIRVYAVSVVGTGYSTDYTITVPGDTPGTDDNVSPNLIRRKK